MGPDLQVPGLFGEGPPVLGILLSHAHPDHSGLIVDTNPSIPVYSSRLTFKMAMAASIFANQSSIGKARENILQLGVPARIGPFQVTALPVDHSIAGACAFVIEAAGKRILYTGDLRFHGRKPGMRRALVEAGRHKSIDVVITEGTTLSRPPTAKTETEFDLEREGFAWVREWEGLVAAHFSPLNLDRLVSFVRLSKRTGRTFVTDPYGAYVLHLARSERVRVPDPSSSENIRILMPDDFWQTPAGRAIAGRQTRMDASSVGMPEILDDPGRFLMLWRPSMPARIAGSSLPSGTLCIRSLWKGYLETDEEKRLAADFAKGGIVQRHLHTSGHANRTDLVTFLKELDANRIVVVHSDRPDALREEFTNVVIANDGNPINV